MMPDVDRRPTAITLKSFLAVLWAPTALGLVPVPGSLRDGPDLFAQLSSSLTVLGCLISVFGLIWGMKREQAGGLLIEQLGLVGIGLGIGMYAFALTTVPKPSEAMLALGLCVGLTAFAAVQYWIINRHRKRIRGLVEKLGAEAPDHGS